MHWRILWRLAAMLALTMHTLPMPVLASQTTVDFDVSSTEPAASSFLVTAPAQVRVTFNDRVHIEGSFLAVIAPGGSEINAGPVRVDSDGRSLIVPLRTDLANGLYSVAFKAVSASNSMAAEGSFDFGLRIGATLPTVRADRERGTPGDLLTLTGTGFKSNGSIVVSAGVDDEFVDAGRADDLGRVQLQIRLPFSLPVGSQPITVADGDGASATARVEITSSSAAPIRVRVQASSQPESVTYEVTVINRSGYDLRLETIRLGVPQGATLARASNNGRLVSIAEVGWDNLRIAGGGTLGPLTIVFDTRGLSDGTVVDLPARVRYVHPAVDSPETARLPRFQNLITSEPASIRVGGLD